MNQWIPRLLLLADEAAQEPSPLSPLFLFGILGVLFWFVIIRPQSREKKRHAELLNEMKKNDRVVSIGGIIGTIADLSADGRSVTLKVDDNTRIKMLRSAIQGPYQPVDNEHAGKD
ncbi:MAG: preprotein translocase subunit YajC [Planctomycetota bacterium]|nr:preprotein translocase subunit YajC [Planctomycetota bacterium]